MFEEKKSCAQYQDYYLIPGYQRYAINDFGELLTIATGKKAKPYHNFKGYLVYYLTSDTGYRGPVTVHRLLMLAFKYPKLFNPKNMTIDHIDGDKRNNDLNNLEWVSATENIKRAVNLGKYVGYDKTCPIETLNPYTNEITYYKSINACRKALGLGRISVQYRLFKGPFKVFPEGLQYRKASPGVPWEASKTPDIDMLNNGVSKSTKLRNIMTGEILSFTTLKNVAEYLSVSPAYLSERIKSGYQPVLPGGYQLKLDIDGPVWRECDYWYEMKKYSQTYEPVEVLVTCSNTLYQFHTISAAASFFGVKGTTSCYRTRTMGATIFDDNSIWAYYPHITTDIVPADSNICVQIPLIAGKPL